MWVQSQDVTEFAQALAAYPIAADEPLVREWGFGGDGGHEIVTSVSIAPEGRTGGLIVDVYLADYYDLFHRCQTRFQTDYPTLDQFRRDLASMMRREAQTAVLSGSEGLALVRVQPDRYVPGTDLGTYLGTYLVGTCHRPGYVPVTPAAAFGTCHRPGYVPVTDPGRYLSPTRVRHRPGYVPVTAEGWRR